MQTVRWSVGASWRLLASLGLVVSLAGCMDNPAVPTLTSQALATGAPWKLQSMQKTGGALVTAPSPERFTLAFDPKGSVAAQADCNRCAGQFTLGTSSLSIGALACTRAACSSAPLDTDYALLLTETHLVSVDTSALTLSSSSGTLRFTR